MKVLIASSSDVISLEQQQLRVNANKPEQG